MVEAQIWDCIVWLVDMYVLYVMFMERGLGWSWVERLTILGKTLVRG